MPKLKLTQKQIVIAIGAAVVVAVLVFVIGFGLRKSSTGGEVKLVIWGLDDKDVFEKLIAGYKQARPNVTVTYEKVDEDGYRSALLNALAAGAGPDVIVLGSHSVPAEKNILTPAPQTQFDAVKLDQLFPRVVSQDFVLGGEVYALPLYLDTMALIYNKDLFDQGGVVSPPKTWNEFQNLIPALRLLNNSGQIVRAAAAIGGSEKNVDSGVDLLQLLMLQNGTPMTDDGLTAAKFAGSVASASPGLQAFNFYLQFGNAASSYYTWNDSQPDSLDGFAAGNVAMIFDYHSKIAGIKAKSPYLNLGVAPLPQVQDAVLNTAYADYRGLAVSKQSKASAWAWDFIIYLTANPDNEKIYLNATSRPPALRSLIAERANDPEFFVFTRQALTARSWYQPDDLKVYGIFNTAIASVLSGETDSERALKAAEDQVTQLMRK